MLVNSPGHWCDVRGKWWWKFSCLWALSGFHLPASYCDWNPNKHRPCISWFTVQLDLGEEGTADPQNFTISLAIMSNSNNGRLKLLWPAVLRQTKLLCFDFGKACLLLRSQQICASGWKSWFLNRCQYAGSVRSNNHIRFFLCSVRWGEGRSPARPGSWGWQCIAGRGSLGADSFWTSKIFCCLEAIFFSGLHAAAGKIIIKHQIDFNF